MGSDCPILGGNKSAVAGLPSGRTACVTLLHSLNATADETAVPTTGSDPSFLIRGCSMHKLALPLALIPLVTLFAGCTDELPVAPPTFSEVASSGTFSGEVFGPDGTSICNFVVGENISVRLVPEVGGYGPGQVISCWASGGDSHFSFEIPAGTYYVRLYLSYDPYVVIWFPDQVTIDGDVEQDLHVPARSSLGGSATVDGGSWAGVSLHTDLVGGRIQGGEPIVSGADGSWLGSLFNGWTYTANCNTWEPLFGIQLVAGAPSEPFLFPDEVASIDCTYELHPWAPPLGVAVNNYRLAFEHPLIPALERGAFYDGASPAAVMFGGGMTYATDEEHTFLLHDPRGVTQGNIRSVGLPIEVFEPGPYADHQTLTLLREWPNDPSWNASGLGLIVVRETFAFTSTPDDDYIIFKHTVFNPGAEPIEGLTVGQEFDHDVYGAMSGSFNDNSVEYDAGSQVAVITSEGIDVVAGHALLGGSPSSYRSWANRQDPPPIDPGDLSPWHDYLTGGIVDPSSFGPEDIRHLLSSGPVTLEAGASVAFASVLAAGDDQDDLLANVAAARAKYAALPPAAVSPYPAIAVDVAVTEYEGYLEAVFTFPDRATALLVNSAETFCAGARSTGGSSRGIHVAAAFPMWLDPTWIGEDGKILCVGMLTDGTVFGGADAPSIGTGGPGREYDVIDLGTLPGCDGSGAHAINNRGQVAGGSCGPVLWDNGVITELGMPTDYTYCWVWDINDLGQVVGECRRPGYLNWHAFLWENGTVTDLGTPGERSVASGINNRGQIVGFQTSHSGTESHAVLWEDGVMTDLGLPDGESSWAFAINERGQAVGGSKTAAGDEYGFLWENGVLRDLSPLGGAGEINERGQIIVGDLLWEGGVITNLGSLGGQGYYGTVAEGINEEGQIVGDSYNGAGARHGFMWENGIMTDLGALPGADYSRAWDINDQGQIVGSSQTELGKGHAVLWVRKH
jgi:probable HAF family extracellular repeat protein